MSRLLVSVPEAAEMLGITAKGLWGMIGKRSIETVKVGRLRKIPVSAIQAFIAQNTIPARPQGVR